MNQETPCDCDETVGFSTVGFSTWAHCRRCGHSWALLSLPQVCAQPPLRTFAAWEAEVARLGKHYDPNADFAVHVALGLAGEVGEVVELIKKDRFQAQPLDREKLCLELGDVLWYLTNMAAGFGLTLEQIANANREKLRKRYPNSFTPGGGVR